MESKKRAVTVFYIILLIVCAGMLCYADTNAGDGREDI